ncbi:pyridine nucleotide-disulfide oxidoreductase [Streptomyces sp. NPDC002734]|uniref:NAD(P)/FAD-dependent oxidoreductase n=1 Tax=Streptomyces sp. NPDC002734 TaxID=3154426 RepID=UPI00332DD71B
MVVGASLGGLLAAAALADQVDQVTVVERDTLPDEPAFRKGLPQSRHAHILLPSGRQAIEDLVPDLRLRESILEAGGRDISMTADALMTGPAGWFRRWPQRSHCLLTCSRELLDFVVRRAVLSHPGIAVLKAEATGLTGTAERVTGVRLAGADPLTADVVVDAGGRGSRAVPWLEQLGTTGIPEAAVDAGLVYASRLFRIPAGAESLPLIMLQSVPDPTRPSRSAVLVPIEGDRWLVSVSGSRGGEPSSRAEDFAPYALSLRDPLVGRLISGAEPLSDVMLSRSTGNRRRHFEKARLPDGFVALGDAVASFNPVYGQGITVAALSAKALKQQAQRGRLDETGASSRVQREIGKQVDAAWALSASMDRWVPGVEGDPPSLLDRALSRYTRRMARVATTSYKVSAAMCDVTTLQVSGAHLLKPSLVAATVAGPRLPLLDGPPLTAEERAILRRLDRTGQLEGALPSAEDGTAPRLSEEGV